MDRSTRASTSTQIVESAAESAELLDADEQPAHSSLSSDQVDRLRLRHEAGESLHDLAQEFRTSFETLRDFVVRRW